MLKITTKTAIGVDISVNGTGVVIITNDSSLGGSIIKNSKFKLYYAGLIKGVNLGKKNTHYTEKIWTPNGGLKEEKIIGEASDFMRGHLVTNKYLNPLLSGLSITDACVESYAFQAVGRVFDITEFSTPIKIRLMEEVGEKNFNQIPPQRLKKIFSGQGSNSKEGNLFVSKYYYGLDFVDDNLADAFALSMCCIQGKF